MKFKVGDRVRILRNRSFPQLVGEIGIVTEILGDLPRRPSELNPGKFRLSGKSG